MPSAVTSDMDYSTESQVNRAGKSMKSSKRKRQLSSRESNDTQSQQSNSEHAAKKKISDKKLETNSQLGKKKKSSLSLCVSKKKYSNSSKTHTSTLEENNSPPKTKLKKKKLNTSLEENDGPPKTKLKKKKVNTSLEEDNSPPKTKLKKKKLNDSLEEDNSPPKTKLKKKKVNTSLEENSSPSKTKLKKKKLNASLEEDNSPPKTKLKKKVNTSLEENSSPPKTKLKKKKVNTSLEEDSSPPKTKLKKKKVTTSLDESSSPPKTKLKKKKEKTSSGLITQSLKTDLFDPDLEDLKQCKTSTSEVIKSKSKKKSMTIDTGVHHDTEEKVEAWDMKRKNSTSKSLGKLGQDSEYSDVQFKLQSDEDVKYHKKKLKKKKLNTRSTTPNSIHKFYELTTLENGDLAKTKLEEGKSNKSNNEFLTTDTWLKFKDRTLSQNGEYSGKEGGSHFANIENKRYFELQSNEKVGNRKQKSKEGELKKSNSDSPRTNDTFERCDKAKNKPKKKRKPAKNTAFEKSGSDFKVVPLPKFYEDTSYSNKWRYSNNAPQKFYEDTSSSHNWRHSNNTPQNFHEDRSSSHHWRHLGEPSKANEIKNNSMEKGNDDFAPEKEEQSSNEKNDLDTNENDLPQICDPEELYEVGQDTYIAVLLPHQSLYLNGLVSVRPLVGRISILGHHMDALEQRDVFSFNTHALLNIEVLEGMNISVSKHSYLVDYKLSQEQIRLLEDKQMGPVVILELKKRVLPISKKLTLINEEGIMRPKKSSEQTLPARGMIISQDNSDGYHLFSISQEWRTFIEDIQIFFECGTAPRVIICGGKGVGKSTLLKFLINSFLNQKGTKVQCLDLDPGQSELSVPSCISLTQVSEPLLGPSFTHLADPLSEDVKHMLIGGVSPQFGLQRYLKAMEKLLELSTEHPNYPLVVNTMGWTVGTGLDLIFDTIRTVKPTHVVQINSRKQSNNFEIRLECSVISSSRGGIHTTPMNDSLHYRLTEFPSMAGKRKNIPSFSSRLLREIAVGVQFGDVLIDIATNSTREEESPRYRLIIPWSDVVLYVCGAKLPRKRILQVLNGNLIAMCQVDNHRIESAGSQLPKHLINDLDFGQCLGWGIVRGVDPVTRCLHILTSFPRGRLNEVNALIMPELHLSDKVYSFFTEGEGPYFQKLDRVGAGKLTIGRQIKPKMANVTKKRKGT